ncbi:unnamed protein product, partial [Meganyctiphanes norvegica]
MEMVMCACWIEHGHDDQFCFIAWWEKRGKQNFKFVLIQNADRVMCGEGQFRCLDKLKCIPQNWRCDFAPDCLDASDEPEDCPVATCAVGTFTCNITGRCLPTGWVCDGEADCGAGDTSDEDEATCKKGNPCPSNYFRCEDGISCRVLKKVCDGTSDCPDSSDEGSFCREGKDACKRLEGTPQQCIYGCKPTPSGPRCFCPLGQQPNGTKCIDSNECEVEGSCDQSCFNEDPGFHCACVEGYKLYNDTRCSAIGVPPDERVTFIYVSNTKVERLHTNGFGVVGQTQVMTKHALAVEFDHRNRTVYWVTANTSGSAIYAADADNMHNQWKLPHPPHYNLDYVMYVARDWITGNWYILDSREMIFMCNATMSVCITLMDVVLNKPRGIALDPTVGYMFFTDWGTTAPKLERALMDGSQREQIVNRKIVYPFGVTVDYANRHVYWVDGYLSHVERVNYDGSNRRVILQLNSDERPMGVTIFENNLFITSWRDSSIKKVDRFKSNVTTIKTNLNEPSSIHIFHRQRQPDVSHPCGINNGDCNHICIPLFSDGKPVVSCRCQPGYTLVDNTACVAEPVPAFLLYAKGRPGMIKGVALEEDIASHEVMVPITSLTRPTTLDFDVKSQFIYYADIQRFVIERQSIDGSIREPVVTTGVLNVEGLAVDWMGRNIYWTDEIVMSI